MIDSCRQGNFFCCAGAERNVGREGADPVQVHGVQLRVQQRGQRPVQPPPSGPAHWRPAACRSQDS